jgi:hypothetical protein
MSAVTYDDGRVQIAPAEKEKARSRRHWFMRILQALEEVQQRRADRVIAKYAPSFAAARDGAGAARHRR